MVPYKAFICLCERGNVVLRESHQPQSRSKLYYAFPLSKERLRLLGSPKPSTPPSYSPRPSTPLSYSSGSSRSAPSNRNVFRIVDPEKWEFAYEEFLKDKKHLLKNIYHKNPVHSHSTPQTSTVDPERAAFEEEIEKLTREKTSHEKNIIRYKQQQPASKLQPEDLTQRVSMDQRQDALLIFLKKAAQNPEFVQHLAQKLKSMDFSADNKKRR
nr:heat stress transcription factor A-5 [Tanacetum cinerariifolium]